MIESKLTETQPEKTQTCPPCQPLDLGLEGDHDLLPAGTKMSPS